MVIDEPDVNIYLMKQGILEYLIMTFCLFANGGADLAD